jgi:DNA polymerase-3 subunit delta
MAKKTESTTGAKDRIILYHGADDAQKRKAVEKLTSELIDRDFGDFDLEQLYGPDVTADRLLTASIVPPIASKRRVLVVFQANEIPAGEQQALAGKLDRIPDSAVVVLVCPAPEMKDGKPKSGSELHKELLPVVKKAGQVVDFPLLKDQAAIPLVQQMARDAGKSISSTAAATLVHRSGTDQGILASEVEKLISYTGERKTIVDEDVEEVTAATVEEKIFAMIDAVGQKRAAEALKLLKPLLYGGGGRVEGPALRTLTMLARHFRQLWQARMLADAGCRVFLPGSVPPQIEAALPSDASILKEKDWKTRKLVEQAKNFSLEDLSDAFERILGVDLALKGIEGDVSDPGLAMELLIIQLSTRANAKKGR